MENVEIFKIWESYDKRLNENLVLNRQNADDITKMKVHSSLNSMRPLKVFALLAGLLWVGFVDTLIIESFAVANPFFLISAGIQVLLTKAAIAIYLYQLIVISQVDITGPVVAIQEKIATLKSSSLLGAKILFLQLPVWSTFYLSGTMLGNGDVWLYTFQIIITVSFTYLSVWLFVNIRYENRNRKWFRMIFNGKEWSPVIKSMELMDQINEYKKEK